MNLINTAKIALLTGFAAAALMTQPMLAHAEEITTVPDDGVAAINHGVTVLAWARVDGVSPAADDVIVDGTIITGENYDTSSDPEWKYIPVRRYATFDGRLLTAKDLTTEQNHAIPRP